jgi:hypothetical protein
VGGVTRLSDDVDRRVSRRAALKKAAVGGGVGAAVWAAPRVDGLKLVPNYAAASSQLPVNFLGQFDRFFTWNLASHDPTVDGQSGNIINYTDPSGLEATVRVDGVDVFGSGTWSVDVTAWGPCTECTFDAVQHGPGGPGDVLPTPTVSVPAAGSLPIVLTKDGVEAASGPLNTPDPYFAFPVVPYTLSCI